MRFLFKKQTKFPALETPAKITVKNPAALKKALQFCGYQVALKTFSLPNSLNFVKMLSLWAFAPKFPKKLREEIVTIFDKAPKAIRDTPKQPKMPQPAKISPEIIKRIMGKAKEFMIFAAIRLKQGPISQLLIKDLAGGLLLELRNSKEKMKIFSTKQPKNTQIVINC